MKRSLCLLLFSLLVSALLAACSPAYKCEGVRDYMYAEEFPALQSPPGLDVPKPDADMRIPDVADGPVRYYKKPSADPREYDFSNCLVAPPPPA